MSLFISLLVTFVCILVVVNANYNATVSSGSLFGIDVSTLTSVSSAQCYASNNVNFIIPRGYKSSGAVDTNVCGTLTNSKNAGITHRDTYLFRLGLE